MAPSVNLSVPGPVETPPTVSMATSHPLHGIGPNGALLECAGGSDGRGTHLVPRESESKDDGDKERNLCAVHMTALPEVRHVHHSRREVAGLEPPVESTRRGPHQLCRQGH